MSEQDALEDIYQTSLCLATRGADGKGEFAQLLSGIQRIRNYIFSESYHLEKAIVHASYTAYLATLIKYNARKIERFTGPSQVKDWYITEPVNTRLNKLKKSSPEAFFYWYKVSELLPG